MKYYKIVRHYSDGEKRVLYKRVDIIFAKMWVDHRLSRGTSEGRTWEDRYEEAAPCLKRS